MATDIGRRNPRLSHLLPLIMSAAIILADQLTKNWIVARIPDNTIGFKFMGDFLWIIHTRNLGIAFSIGDSISRLLRVVLFIGVPGAFLIAAAVYCYVSKRLSLLQRYAVALIIGGGIGNLLDRIFRAEGVVDFISFSLFGLFGMDRFATFNIADLSITVGASILLVSGFLMDGKEARDDKRD